jgi:hypothetical protein
MKGESSMLERRRAVFGVVAFLFWSAYLVAQGPCPTATSTQTSSTLARSSDLICLIPQVYGGGGLVGVDHGGPLVSTGRFSHAAHFTNSSLLTFSPFNAEIGTQLSLLPLARLHLALFFRSIRRLAWWLGKPRLSAPF